MQLSKTTNALGSATVLMAALWRFSMFSTSFGLHSSATTGTSAYSSGCTGATGDTAMPNSMPDLATRSSAIVVLPVIRLPMTNTTESARTRVTSNSGTMLSWQR